MSEGRIYSAADCAETGYGMSIDKKVIVVKADVLPNDDGAPAKSQILWGEDEQRSGADARHEADAVERSLRGRDQLFFCTGGFGSNPNPSGRTVFAVSLSTGEHCRWYRSDVIGSLKPELLPDSARLYLSQIRPGGNPAPAASEFFGFCFLENGRYSGGVPLKDAEEAVRFAEMQAPYQYRVLVCDREDCTVMEVVNGAVVFPAQEQTGGMTMT